MTNSKNNIKPLNPQDEKTNSKNRHQERKGSKSAILYDDLSENFLETYSVKTLEDGDLRIYENGIYHACKNKYSANNLMINTAASMGLTLSPTQIRESLEMVKSKTPGEEVKTPLNLIPVNNGVLNLDTLELEEYTPENVFLSKYPINFNPDAPEPVKFNKMLKTTFAEVEYQIPLVQEIFGYCFLRSYYIAAMFFFVGNGGNGKSLLLNILSALLGGSEHCSYLSFKELAEPKNESMLYDLYGKSANICGDTGKQAIKETDTLKKATCDDYIRARRLYQEGFNFKNHAKVILSFNKAPEVEDFSDGFKRRLNVIKFPNAFIGDDANKNLEAEIVEGGELEGVFLWALEGLKRLLETNELSNKKSLAERGAEYARMSNPMAYFVRECIEYRLGGFTRKAEIFEAYTKYANYNGLPQLTAQELKKEFIRECREIDIETREKRNQKESDRPYGFIGVVIDKAALAEKTGEEYTPSPTELLEGKQATFKQTVSVIVNPK